MSSVDDGEGPDIPEKSWTNPYHPDHPLHDLFGRRVRNHQDLVIILDDYHSRRGTGKTVASLQLAEGMDQNGGIGWDNVSMAPEEIRNAYADLPERSGLVLDEGEIGASNRKAMTKTNQALRDIMSMGRIEEKYLMVNTPSIGFIDKDIRLLADVWITMLAKGIGLVHFLKRQPYAQQGKGKLLTEKKGLIEFKDIQKGTRLRKVYNKLSEEKRKHIRGERGGGFVPEDEHQEALQQARKEARREGRNEAIRGIYRNPEIREAGVTQEMIGNGVGLAQRTISHIVDEDGDT